MTNLRAYSLLLLLFLWQYSYAQRPLFIAQENHSNLITALSISEDGKWFATGSHDNQVKIWDAESGLLIQGFALYDYIRDIQFLRDKNYLYVATYGIQTTPLVSLSLYDNSISGHEHPLSIHCLQKSKSERFQVYGHNEGYISFYDVKLDTSVYLKFDSTYSVKTLAFNTDESLILGASSEYFGNNQICLFSTSDFNRKELINTGDLQILSAEFIDTKRVLLFGREKFVSAYYLLDTSNGKLEKLNIKGNGLCFDRKRNGFYLFNENDLLRYDLTSKKTQTLFRFNTKLSSESQIELNLETNLLVIAGRNIAGFDLESNKLLYEIPAKYGGFEAMLFTSEDLIFNSGKGQLSFMDLHSNHFETYTDSIIQNGSIVHMTLDESEQYFALLNSDSVLAVYSQKEGFQYSHRFPSNKFVSLTIDPSSEVLATSMSDSLFFFDLKSGRLNSKSDLDLPGVEKQIRYSPNGNHLALVAQHYAALYDFRTESYQTIRSSRDGSIEAFAFSSDGKYFALGGYGDSIEVYNTENQELVYGLAIQSDYVHSLAFEPGTYNLISGHRSGYIVKHIFKNGHFNLEFSAQNHYSSVTQLSFSEDDGILFSASHAGQIVLSDISDLTRIAQLVTFSDGTWAIVDEEGRYDAPNGGDIPHMHFVLGNEPIELSQLRERAFDPGLLQKLLGYNKEALLNTTGLDSINLYPEFKLQIRGNELEIQAKLRDRALGKVALYINGIERNGNLTSLFEMQPGDSSIYTARIDLTQYKSYFRFEENNAIGVIGYNADNFLASRLISKDFKPDPKLKSFGSAFDRLKQEPKLYALVIGTSNYRGTDLDLKFADNDALRFSSALEQTASLLFEKQNVFVQTYTTSSETLPTKSVIQKSFQELKSKITPNDVLVVYFSGHGATYTEEGKDYFYYLTADMNSSNVSDPFVRSNFTISSNELANWISELPVERNVLILDACFSGSAVNDLLAISKSSEGSNERAIQRMKHRLGTFILTGSAPNQVSFESAKYKQSLLTYALLSAMRGEKLVEDQFVDVYELFTYAAENVPKYAATIGSVQYPKIAQSAGSSFYIGKVGPEVNIEVEVVRPTLIRSQFIDSEELDDMLDLSYRADEALRNLSFKQNELFDFSDVRTLDAAYYLRGEYVQKGENLEITCILKQDKTEIDRKIISVSKNDLEKFEVELMEFVMNSIH